MNYLFFEKKKGQQMTMDSLTQEVKKGNMEICIWMTQTRRHRTNSGWANNAVA